MPSLQQDLMKYVEYVKSRQDLLTHIIDDKTTNLEDMTLIKEKMDSLAEPVNLISRLMTKIKLLENSLDISMSITRNLIDSSEEKPRSSNEYFADLVKLGKEIDEV